MTQTNRLAAISIPGLPLDSLGNYLASLGLLRVLARKWPTVRIAWRDGILQVVGGPETLDELFDELCRVAEKRGWSPYDRKWLEAQKKGTKAKSGEELANWRAKASEQDVEIFDSHTVAAARVSFNPLLGKGGSAGNRDFSDGRQKAVDTLATIQYSKPRKNETSAQKEKRLQKNKEHDIEFTTQRRLELNAWLCGHPTSWMLKKLNAASWFSASNKLYNSGQNAFREGQISPWAMVLACEGLCFLSGSASKRLGAASRSRGAFPFVTQQLAPTVLGDVKHDLAEFWAPVWCRPMTSPEVRSLIARGRAEVLGAGARTPSAFAGAILHRGVDAGIEEFRRFVLGRTTSANTFESRFEGVFRLSAATSDQSADILVADAIDCVLSLIDRLPPDRDRKGQPRFIGLRGPIEATSVAFAASPSDSGHARDMLDSIVPSLDRVDRNRGFRAAKVAWKPLPIEWLPALFNNEQPSVEARLALSLVSGFPQSLPFALYRFGVKLKSHGFQHSEQAPARWVWGAGPAPAVLSRVLLRRMLDWEAEAKRDTAFAPARITLPARLSDVRHWLDGTVDDDLFLHWLSRFALFDWRYVPAQVRTLALSSTPQAEQGSTFALFGLLGPLFDLLPVKIHTAEHSRDALRRESGARTPAFARALANMIRGRQIDQAVRMAFSRYVMASIPLIRTHTAWGTPDSDRLLTAMLFTVSDHDRSSLIQPWLRPQRLTGEAA
ncbi:MAG TPA: type I-U CRISPR-associated protein Csx17 [Rhodanobacteraceae bacterium]|nr:type I-U CRISPR-associated protein Csx17 [Rhodanobacteraceae bacterium]